MISDPVNIFVADFGKLVVIHPKTGDREITAIFDDAFFDSQLGETVLDTRQERITAVEGDVSDLKREDKVTIGCNEYEVIAIKPDGTGMATVELSKI